MVSIMPYTVNDWKLLLAFCSLCQLSICKEWKIKVVIQIVLGDDFSDLLDDDDENFDENDVSGDDDDATDSGTEDESLDQDDKPLGTAFLIHPSYSYTSYTKTNGMHQYSKYERQVWNLDVPIIRQIHCTFSTHNMFLQDHFKPYWFLTSKIKPLN